MVSCTGGPGNELRGAAGGAGRPGSPGRAVPTHLRLAPGLGQAAGPPSNSPRGPERGRGLRGRGGAASALLASRNRGEGSAVRASSSLLSPSRTRGRFRIGGWLPTHPGPATQDPIYLPRPYWSPPGPPLREGRPKMGSLLHPTLARARHQSCIEEWVVAERWPQEGGPRGRGSSKTQLSFCFSPS